MTVKGMKQSKIRARSAGKSDLALGRKIRLRRIEQSLSQHDLGDQLGVSFQQVQKYEKGTNRVSASRLQAIAAALETPIGFFYEGNGKSSEIETLLYDDDKFSLRLLRAYNKVADLTTKRRLVTLLEAMAQIEPEISEA